MSKTIKCIICNSSYHTCDCPKDLHTWKVLCDTTNHYQIYLVLSDYNFGNITKARAKQMLAKLDISNYQNWGTNASKQIKEILEDKKDTIVKTKRK